MNKSTGKISGVVLLLIIVLASFLINSSPNKKTTTWTYNDLVAKIEKQQISSIVLYNDSAEVLANTTDGLQLHLIIPNDPHFTNRLLENNIPMSVEEKSSAVDTLGFVVDLLFPFLLLGAFLFVLRAVGGSNSTLSKVTKTSTKTKEDLQTVTTFADVAGVDSAKNELRQLVDFLQQPDKFTKFGARIPKGALLIGPPGTGKTLLARAVAGEANVPFFSMSGSEFVELFVGIGASRVRSLFNNAKENAPCIVFIDEIDAIGKQRGAGLSSSNDEREQTLNQLLTELDGFAENTGVIVLAATNRPDVLDAALLRPGRFDRQILVDLPDLNGRIKIFGVHSKNKRLSSDINLEELARRVPGFTGADIANLMNEAAILAACKNLTTLGQDEINEAIDRVIAGAERKGYYMSQNQKRLIAYHEAGHALVGALLPNYRQVQKISIIPRGRAAGLTWFAPNEEQEGLYTKEYLLAQITVALGGRCAEELIFGTEQITTGASNDLQQVKQIAYDMVTRYGMTNNLGPIAFGTNHPELFLGRDLAASKDYSEVTATIVDQAIFSIITECYQEARILLREHLNLLHTIAIRLMEYETIDAQELAKLL